MDNSDNVAGMFEVMNVHTSTENNASSQCLAAEGEFCGNAALPNQCEVDMDSPDENDTGTSLKIEIFDFLVKNKKAHFRSQQRGEPDLSVEEKKRIAEDLFSKTPSGFLSRFGHLLSRKHLEHFYSFQYSSKNEKEEVEYRLSYLGASNSKSSKTRLKNRRYDALQKMISNGSYFSMEEMQARNPLLFEQLVGKYQTEEEKQPKQDVTPGDNEFPWMQHFAKQVEKDRMEKFKEQQELDEASNGDEDSSDEADNQIPKRESTSDLWGEYRGKFQKDSSIPQQKKKSRQRRKENLQNFQNASEEEKAFYLQEFQTAMYHSFLSGNDKDFDYSSVDNNSDYDCVDMRERDEQDQYFDQESPDAISQADMDVTDNSLDEHDRFPEGAVNPSGSTSAAAIEEDLDTDISDVCGRLTQDDVKNLKTFASSWANSLAHSSCVKKKNRNPITSSSVADKGKYPITLPVHKVPVKKNHKIKIHLKTKEM